MAAAEIHPTAIVDPSAELGAGSVVGPYCVIGAGVVMGEHCTLQNHVTIMGPSIIGRNNTFYCYGSIGQRSQDLKYSAEPTHLQIGDGNTFREFVTVNRATEPGSTTRIGSDGNFLAYSHVAHDCTVGDNVIFSNNGTLAGHVVIEDGAILGGLSAIHQFCRMGKLSMTGGCAKIVKDIPPFMIADGNPGKVRGVNTVGLQRAGFSEEDLREIKEAYRVLYRQDLNTTQALEILRESNSPHVAYLVQFIESSERGILA